jgi:hypothetical protein
MVVTAALLVSATAAADPQGKEQSVKGDKGGGGGGGSAGAGGATTDSAGPDVGRTDADHRGLNVTKYKPWEVSAGWEGHRLVRQSDLEGAAPDKFFNYYYASGYYEVTKHDRFTLTAGLYQRFLADPGETGVRADDIVGSYRHWIELPAQFDFYGSFSLVAPTSFVSFREGLITAPRVGLRLDKGIGDYILLSARTSGSYYWERYNTMRDGTSPNPLARVAGGVDADVTMPFHKPLSAGVSLYTNYYWYHNATSTLPAGATNGSGQVGTTTGNQPAIQPISQSYGGEIHVRYLLPDFVTGLHTDAAVAYAQGDPSLGFTSALHDGISHVYFFYRLQSELYATLTARY